MKQNAKAQRQEQVEQAHRRPEKPVLPDRESERWGGRTQGRERLEVKVARY